MTDGEEQLAALEVSEDLQRLFRRHDIELAWIELLGENLRARVGLLMHWTVMYPAATSQLLGWLAKDREASIELAPAVLGCDVLDDSDVDSVLIVAFPSLVGEVRAAASVRVGQRLGAEVDTSVTPPLVEWLWPTGTPFPPAATVEGVQARLNYFDLGAGPVTGVWNEQTGRAFRRWKVLNGFDPIEECDDDARESLGYRAPDAP